MKVWITCVLVLYGMVEVYQWMKHFSLPLPVFILGGAVLAIASNYGKYAGWSFQPQSEADTKSGKIPSIEETQKANWTNLNSSSAKPLPKPVSFTIHPATQKEVLHEDL